MSGVELAIIGFILFVGGTVIGAIGFGNTLVTVPFLSLFFEPREVIILLSISILLTNLANVQTTLGEWRSLRLTVAYFLTAITFIPVGVMYLSWGDPNVIRLLMGMVVYLFLMVHRLLPPMNTLNTTVRQGVGVCLGAVLGFMFGVTTINGPINTIYFTMLNVSKDAFIFLMNACNSISAVILIASLTFQSAYTGSSILSAFGALVPIFLGFWMGFRLRGRIREELFYRVVRIGLFCIATILVGRYVWSAF